MHVIAEQNIKAVASEIFNAIGLDDVSFIDTYQLNNPDSMDRGEAFIRRTATKQVGFTLPVIRAALEPEEARSAQ